VSHHDPTHLAPLVRKWLPTQRWFAGKGRDATLSVTPLADLPAEHPVTLWAVRVEYADGEPETYQLPLVTRTEPAANLEHVLLGTVETDDGPVWVYDALHDKEVTPAWLAGMQEDSVAGAVRFVRYAESPDDIPVHEPSLVLSGEQSNTSMVFGDVAIMKVFRRLHRGVNPDIEVQAVLSRLGARHIPVVP